VNIVAQPPESQGGCPDVWQGDHRDGFIRGQAQDEERGQQASNSETGNGSDRAGQDGDDECDP
jgi:hypothetical protein